MGYIRTTPGRGGEGGGGGKPLRVSKLDTRDPNSPLQFRVQGLVFRV